MKRLLWISMLTLLLLAVPAGLAALAWSPYRDFKDSLILEFPKGTSSSTMAKRLADAGIVRHPLLFTMARAMRPSAKLQAGEYEFIKAASAVEIVDRLARGDVHYYELSIREGSNLFDVAAAVDQLGFLKGADFLEAARNPAPVKDLAPNAQSLEGFLFPATYRLTRSSSVDLLIRMMTEQFRKEWKIALKGAPPPGNALAVVTLSSLVEKESGVPAERPLVASVYKNRLEKKIKLDCDPTTIYAAILEGRYRGTIYKSDLASENPYNTYRHPGLPPGPIANPGLASLEAALRPAETNYMYFVAKGDGSGGHNFSTDYQTHQQFVAQYRQRLRK